MSSSFSVIFEYKNDNFKITFDNQFLGFVTRNGKLLNHKKEVIGNAIHPPKYTIQSGIFKYRAGNNYYKVIIGDTEVSTIWVCPLYSTNGKFGNGLKFEFNENDWNSTILDVHSSLNEKKWVTSLAILEIAYHGCWLV